MDRRRNKIFCFNLSKPGTWVNFCFPKTGGNLPPKNYCGISDFFKLVLTGQAGLLESFDLEEPRRS